jgi:uncharacterized membrane protein YqiK
MDIILAHWHLICDIAIGLVLFLLGIKWLPWLCGVRIVPDDSIGVITKKFVLSGAHRNLPAGKIIAMNGEAGFQAYTLPPGLHLGYFPWQYTVELVKFFTVPQGKVGCVEACDGMPLPSGRIVARQVVCDSFQDAVAFLSNGGERGPQMALIAPGQL